MKRLNSNIPDDLYQEMVNTADSHGITITELMRKFIKLGLIASEISKKDNARLIVEDDGEQREIVFY